MFTTFLRAAVLVGVSLPCWATPAPLTLEAALRLAVERSDASRAAHASILGATETLRMAGQLPDPVLRVGIDNLPSTGPDRFSATRDSMTMKRIGLSQEWLSADKRLALEAAARAGVEREMTQQKVADASTRLQTALAYVDASYSAEMLQLATLMEHHAHEELEASRARLSSATGSSQEVLFSTGARGTAEDDSADIRQQQNQARLALQRWVGTMPDELAPMPSIAVSGESAYLERHPVIVAMQRSLDVAAQAAAVAGTNRRPNWTWEVSYGQRTGYSDMVSVGVTIPLAIAPGERQDREAAAKLALVSKAEAELAEAMRTAIAEYQGLRSDDQRLQERIERYRAGVVSVAAQRTSAATAAYRSNQASLVMLFEARHAEVDTRRKLLGLQRDLARVRVQMAFRPLVAEVSP